MLMLAGCNHLVQRGITSSGLAPHPDPQATTAQISSPDLAFTTYLMNALAALAADPHTAYLATTSAIRVAIDAHLTKYKVYLARLVACLAAVFLLKIMCCYVLCGILLVPMLMLLMLLLILNL
ncbi:MAG: hypothetical protein NMK33_03140 [Candidatus Cardinium sp.]|nr:MAG: hypothetical protein NMK33_03140 [Candidatus Cardinium sp.]